MKSINEDIKNNNYSKVYLLYGPETYLRLQARNNLKKALCAPDDTLNVAFFSKDNPDQPEIIDFANTLPFLAEKRVLFIEDTNLFGSASDELIDFIGDIPESTVMIFVQEAVDRRSRLYKAISASGRTIEFKTPSAKDLENWLLRKIKQANIGITRSAMDQLFMQVGTNDMVRLESEFDKLICYCLGKESITANDVMEICTVSVEDKVFDMVDAMVNRNRRRAHEVYDDLLKLKVPPMRILSTIAGQYNNILIVKDLTDHNKSLDFICDTINRRDFAVKKMRSQASRYTYDKLHAIINDCVELEQEFKSGKIAAGLTVELIIGKYS